MSPWHQSARREALHLVVVVAWVALVHQAVGAFEVEGVSMAPTLQPHQFVVVDRVAPSLRLPQRGEVIVFRFPRNPSLDYVKRVIGLPGESVRIAGGRVFINGQPLTEPYVLERPRYNWGPGAIPEANVFVLGDNRNSSSDSHLWGMVPMDNVIGRAWFAYRPMYAWKWLAGQTPTTEATSRVG